MTSNNSMYQLGLLFIQLIAVVELYTVIIALHAVPGT